MWLFTTIGFFSVVQKTGDLKLTVRARSAADLDRLRQQFMPGLSATSNKGGSDYPFRATVSRKDFTTGLSRLGDAIDYHNFKDAVAERMGAERTHIYHKVWSVLRAIEKEQPVSAPVDRPAIRGVAYGGVVVNAEGKLLLREPKNHFDGYVWTFPKGKAERGESEQQAALREVHEETGVEAKISKRIPGEFQGGTSKSIYFLMTPAKDTGQFDNETQRTDWFTIEEAANRIQQTANPIGRKRDLAVLQAAAKIIG